MVPSVYRRLRTNGRSSSGPIATESCACAEQSHRAVTSTINSTPQSATFRAQDVRFRCILRHRNSSHPVDGPSLRCYHSKELGCHVSTRPDGSGSLEIICPGCGGHLGHV